MDTKQLCDNLVIWLKNAVRDANAKGTVLGISGGIDSAVTGILCKRAFTENTLGLIMPCYSDEQDENDARLIAEKYDIRCKKVILDHVYDQFIKAVEKSNDRNATANVKPRLRMTTLYYYASINHYLVVGSTNKSELTVGYFTKHADSGVDLLPLGNLVKSQVIELAFILKSHEIFKTSLRGLGRGRQMK